MTLVFRKLMHVGTREQAEDIIGHVVIECYDYDQVISFFSSSSSLNPSAW